MSNSRRHRVALVTRICPHYVIPLYRMLAQEVDLTVFFGKGKKTGSQQNAKKVEGFKNYKLFTVPLTLRVREMSYYIVLHPVLLFYLHRGNYDVIISEGATNILNLIFISAFCFLYRKPLIIRDSGRNRMIPRSFQRKMLDPLLNCIYNNADAIIAYGDISRDYMISVGVKGEKIFVAQNTVDLDSIAMRIEEYRGKADFLDMRKAQMGLNEKKVILYIGALERRKRVRNLLIALKRIQEEDKEVALLIVGDGPQRKRLEGFVRENAVKNVKFLGRIVEESAQYFLLSDLVVLPGSGNLTTIEAMAYGRTIITVAYGGPEYEIIEDRKTGFLVEKDDIEGLTDTIRELLKGNRLREKVGFDARKSVYNKCGLDKMISEIKKSIEFALAMSDN